MKDFTQEFNKLLNLVTECTPFSFARFSDGEVTILRNKACVLANDYFIQEDMHGSQKNNVPEETYNKEEQKEFYPGKHEFFRRKLLESLLYKKKNYFKGIPPQNSLDGKLSWEFCLDLHGRDDLSHLSFANVMINNNYKRFILECLPVFKNKKIVLIANENSTFENLPFSVSKFFPIGSNCMINNYYLIDEIKEWIKDNSITNHLFLFSASSLSNLLCHALYEQYPFNQYLDIGSSLGPLLGLTGWKGSRTYLNKYWSNPSNPPEQQIDIWN